MIRYLLDTYAVEGADGRLSTWHTVVEAVRRPRPGGRRLGPADHARRHGHAGRRGRVRPARHPGPGQARN
ncbi:hypothetical protein ACFQV4_29265 [Streptomyces thermocarboxydus]